MALTEERKAALLAYCRIDTLEEGEESLLQGLYDAAAGYMEQAGVQEPQEGSYDRRGTQTEGSVGDNPALRRMITQLKLTEPSVSDLDTEEGGR